MVGASDFTTEVLLKSLSRYPVSKRRHGYDEQLASALAGRANSLRTSFNNDLKGAAEAHREIAIGHLKLAKKLSGFAAEANMAAYNGHKTAAERIEAIMPMSGGSLAANAITGDNSIAFSAAAARLSTDALQSVINHHDDSQQEVGIDHGFPEDNSDEDDSGPAEDDEDDGGDDEVDGDGGDVEKAADVDQFAPNAKMISAKHGGLKVDYRGIGGAHTGLGIRHLDFADRLESKAALVRAANDGMDNAESRAFDNAAVAHRDAMQAHYTAGRVNDDAAYTASKVEGATLSTRHSRKNTSYASNVATDASKKADELTQQALAYGKDSMDA